MVYLQVQNELRRRLSIIYVVIEEAEWEVLNSSIYNLTPSLRILTVVRNHRDLCETRTVTAHVFDRHLCVV